MDATTIASVGTDDWLGSCRTAAEEIRSMLDRTVGIEARAAETGTRGSGGDRTLTLDHSAEGIVFAELGRMHARGHRFQAISEERGEVDFGGKELLVVIDPLDGSLNAKRRLPHHALSLAVATGPTVADVAFGFVYDFGTGEEWWAQRGGGAFLGQARLDPDATERRSRDGRLEALGIESADPRWVREAVDELAERAYRLRALGAIAVSLCQVAAARLDGLVTLHSCRAFDAAAGALIVREAGGQVSFPRFEDRLAAPLDTSPHSPVVAARNPETLRELEEICRPR